MFQIIGGDGRPYGPIQADQLQQWITEGRANGATLVQVEGAADWKPLSTLPEFAGATAAAAVPPVLQEAGQGKSRLVAGLLGIFLGWLGVHRFYLGYTGIALAQLLLTVLSFFTLVWAIAVWGLIEGILILCGSAITTDSKGVPLKDS